ncbi:hypothetical protein EJ02DRAFT_439071 [Clathrospora elynae]|uniref:Uncharacterized protein n=1 Tax=Clathrospora elynae TaxID=706981 RepID=A0A6A5S7C1_9PLEO|nr:hypothetical protein EJ02DRAFT_439071 [Clathrospora elynae]
MDLANFPPLPSASAGGQTQSGTPPIPSAASGPQTLPVNIMFGNLGGFTIPSLIEALSALNSHINSPIQSNGAPIAPPPDHFALNKPLGLVDSNVDIPTTQITGTPIALLPSTFTHVTGYSSIGNRCSGLKAVSAALPLAVAALVGNLVHSHSGPSFDAVDFVNRLEEVDISTITAKGMKFPHCWLPFGTTDKYDPAFITRPEYDPETLECLLANRELPFDDYKPNNDPVKTPCGHISGRACLIESLEKTSTTCPMRRHEFRV